MIAGGSSAGSGAWQGFSYDFTLVLPTDDICQHRHAASFAVLPLANGRTDPTLRPREFLKRKRAVFGRQRRSRLTHTTAGVPRRHLHPKSLPPASIHYPPLPYTLLVLIRQRDEPAASREIRWSRQSFPRRDLIITLHHPPLTPSRLWRNREGVRRKDGVDRAQPPSRKSIPSAMIAPFQIPTDSSTFPISISQWHNRF